MVKWGVGRGEWGFLIFDLQRIYYVDPLLCPQCGGTMKIIAFVEARQDKVIRKILEHCGLWRDPHAPPPRAPPLAAPKAVRAPWQSDSTNTDDMDPDYLEHLHRERQGELPWEP